MELWGEWKSSIIYQINSPAAPDSKYPSFVTNVNSILMTNKLPEPFESYTDDFIDLFCPSILRNILNNDPQTAPRVTLCEKYLMTLIKLFTYSLEHQREKFAKIAINIFNPNVTFYQKTNTINWIGANENQYLKINYDELKNTRFIEKINVLLSGEAHVTFGFMDIILDIISNRSIGFPENGIEYIKQHLLNRIILIATMEEKDIRFIDEENVDSVIFKLSSLVSSQDIRKNLADIRMDIAITMAQCDFVSKKFCGLKLIIKYMNAGTLNKVIEAKLIDKYLDGVHQDLFKDFCLIFRFALVNKKVTEPQIIKLWQLTLNQPPSIIDDYLDGLEEIFKNSEEVETLFQAVIELNEWPLIVMDFLEDLSDKLKSDTMRLSIFNTLFALADCDQIKGALSSFIPINLEMVRYLIESMVQYIEKDDRTGVSLAVCPTLIRKLVPDERSKINCRILTALQNVSEPLQYLKIFAKIICESKELTVEEYECLTTFTVPYIETVEVSTFYITLLKSNIFTLQILHQLYAAFSNIEEFNESSKKALIAVFEMLNVGQKQPLGLSVLFQTYLRTGDETILKFVVDKYSANAGVSMKSFVDRCLSNVSENSLKALLSMIRKMEDPILILSGYLFLTDDMKRDIVFTGDYNSKVSFQCDLTYRTVRKFIGNELCTAPKNVGLYSTNGEINLKKKVENLTICVAAQAKGTKQRLEMGTLPSQYINNTPNADLLFNLIKNDEKLGKIALEILIRLPPNSFVRDINNYKELPEGNPLLMIYIMNYIGCQLEKRNSGIINFLIDGGAEKIINYALFKDLSLAQRINALAMGNVVSYLINDKVGFISKIKDRMGELLNQYYGNQNWIVYHITRIILGLKEEISYTGDFASFFKRSCLDESYLLSDVLMKISKFDDNFCDCVIEALPNSHLPKTTYGTFLTKAAEVTPKPKEMYDILTKDLFTFAVDLQKPFLYQLTFTPPSPFIVNYTMLALSTLIRKCVEIDTEELFNFIVSRILLSETTNYELSSELFELIGVLIDDNLERKQSLYKKLSDIVTIKKSNYTLAPSYMYDKKGFKNLGATCYMASVLQLLFHVPEFRNCVLKEKKDEDWQIAIQDLFFELQFGKTEYVDPLAFTKTWRGWDGEPVNVGMQQDAAEFLTAFLDKCQVFGANMFNGVSQTNISDKDKILSTNKEPWTVLSLSVAECDTINDSLRMYSEPEKISHYKTDAGEIDALRTTALDSLPPFVIVQLKRFEFDIATASKIKVNDALSFPFKLNLGEWTVKGEEDQFELVGVVVHMGSASSGHYFVYELIDGKWYNFNDRNVTQTPKANLKKNWEGGEQEVTLFNNENQEIMKTLQNNTSAYLLLYKRISVADPGLEIDPAILESKLPQIKKELLQRLIESPKFAKLFDDVSTDPCAMFDSFIINTMNDNFKFEEIDRKCNSILTKINDTDFSSVLTYHYFKSLLLTDNATIRENFEEIFRAILNKESEAKQIVFVENICNNILEESLKFMETRLSWGNAFKILIDYGRDCDILKNMAATLVFDIIPTYGLMYPDSNAVGKLKYDDLFKVLRKEDVLAKLDSALTKNILSSLNRVNFRKLIREFDDYNIKTWLSWMLEATPKVTEVNTANATLISGSMPNLQDVLSSCVAIVMKTDDQLSLERFLKILKDFESELSKEIMGKEIPTLASKYLLINSTKVRMAFVDFACDMCINTVAGQHLFTATVNIAASLNNSLFMVECIRLLDRLVLGDKSTSMREAVFTASAILCSIPPRLRPEQRSKFLEMLSNALDDGLYEAVFIHTNFIAFYKSFGELTVEMDAYLSRIVPVSAVNAFVKSDAGKMLLRNGFKDYSSDVELFMNRVAPSVQKEALVDALFEHQSVVRRCIERNTQFSRVCSIVLASASKLTKTIQTSNVHLAMIDGIIRNSKDDFANGCLSFLIKFNQKYLKENRELKKWNKPVIESLAEDYLSHERGKHLQQLIEFSPLLVQSIAALSINARIAVLRLSFQNGNLKMFSPHRKEEANLVAVCIESCVDSTKVIELVERSLMSLLPVNDTESAERIFSIATPIVDEKLSKDAKESFGRSTDLMMQYASNVSTMTGVPLYVANSLEGKGVKFRRDLWTERCGFLVQKLLEKEDSKLEDIEAGVNFILMMKSDYNVEYRFPFDRVWGERLIGNRKGEEMKEGLKADILQLCKD